MNVKLLSLSKNEDFKTLLSGKKVSNKYLTIFFRNLKDKNSKNLNISIVAQKKLGNATQRNKIKRRLKNIMYQITEIIKINLNYSYLIIAKKDITNAKYTDIKDALIKDYNKIK